MIDLSTDLLLLIQAGAPVIWVQHTAGSGAPIFNPDNASYDFIGDVRPVAGEKIIVKQAPSTSVFSCLPPPSTESTADPEFFFSLFPASLELNFTNTCRLSELNSSSVSFSLPSASISRPEKLTPTPNQVTGYMAHVCVTGTARSAMEHGYDVVILRDAIGDRDIPSSTGNGVTTAATLVSVVCDELADAFATILPTSAITA